jgi:hypothetical protein
MLFFRSEAQVREWCEANGSPVRPLVSLGQLWGLAEAWYSTRLQPDSRRPQPREMREIFSRLGVADDFWDPKSDDFGKT